MNIQFLLNGETVSLEQDAPERMLLPYLREQRGLTGTKEGCNEGDCGACTVIVTTENDVKPLNACILMLGQLNGTAVRTVEGLGAENELHPIQREMVDCHASQCGFCTPGIVMSLVAGQINDLADHDMVLSGNLCRCTGYAPIIKAAERAEKVLPKWLEEDRTKLAKLRLGKPSAIHPQSSDEVAALVYAEPKTRLIAGATDIGLWLTKQFAEIRPFAFLSGAKDLAEIRETPEAYHIGATVSIEHLRRWAEGCSPSLAQMLRRYGSLQVREAATIGGNIANGSPIGDTPPALIAAGARLVLRCADNRREIPLEHFFLEYGKQDLRTGEFVEGILVPKALGELRIYKISKRFDQDISAICGGFNIHIDQRDETGIVRAARIAFGGMAGTPKRALHVEEHLIGKPWSKQSVLDCADVWAQDFEPISDARASATYRQRMAQNLLLRYLADLAGQETHVLGVSL